MATAEEPELELTLLHAFHDLVRELSNSTKELSEALNVTARGLHILARIELGDSYPGNLMRELAVASSVITFETDKLVASKLVRRVVDDSDRRRVRLELTPKGTSALAQTYAITRTVLTRRMSKLGGEDQQTFVRLFTKIVD